METITRNIEIGRSLRTVYNQWTQFEDFPHFMEGVKSVRQINDKLLQWEAEIVGKTKIWEAEIYEQVPDQVIAWRSTSGAENSGVALFAAFRTPPGVGAGPLAPPYPTPVDQTAFSSAAQSRLQRRLLHPVSSRQHSWPQRTPEPVPQPSLSKDPTHDHLAGSCHK